MREREREREGGLSISYYRQTDGLIVARMAAGSDICFTGGRERERERERWEGGGTVGIRKSCDVFGLPSLQRKVVMSV